MPSLRSSSTSSPTTSRPTRSSNTRMRHPSPLEENFASPQLTNPRTQDVFQSIVKGRKSWKTLRGGEVVWPPELEAALIEGLENYIPDDSRETRLLGRFPLRNRFISDWIFDKTGKRRSAKQVGSRLQQLRDTCGGRKLLNLLTPRKPIPKRSSSLSPDLAERVCLDGSSRYQDTDSSCSDRSSPGAPTTPTEVHATLQSLLYRGIACSTESPPNSVVYIDLLPGPSGPSKAFPDSSVPSPKQDESVWAERGMDVVRISPQARYITDIDPTVTFASPCLINAVSVFSVYLDDELVYSEDSPLEAAGALSLTHGTYLYSTCLLPSYWGKICQAPDLSRHTIVHRVVEERPSGMPSSHTSKVLFSTMYRFKYSSPNLQLFGNAFDGCADILSPPQQKVQNLRLDVSSPFDSMLHMSSPEVYYDKPQHYYDMTPWNNGTSINSYSH